jgi:hypothetical protein
MSFNKPNQENQNSKSLWSIFKTEYFWIKVAVIFLLLENCLTDFSPKGKEGRIKSLEDNSMTCEKFNNFRNTCPPQ